MTAPGKGCEKGENHQSSGACALVRIACDCVRVERMSSMECIKIVTGI